MHTVRICIVRENDQIAQRTHAGNMLPQTTFSLVLAAGIDPALARRQRRLLGDAHAGVCGGGTAVGAQGGVVGLRLVDPRDLPDEA
jgi:hypothetical protein